VSRPPHHRISPLRIIDLQDKAWDDRWVAEIEHLEGDELRAHPMMAYRLGLSQFDLDAPGVVTSEDGEQLQATARDYLREASPPRFFEARRLTPMELATCLDRGEHVGRLWAFQLAVKGIEGAEGLTYRVDNRKAATDGQVQAAAEALGADILLRIGRFVIDASRHPNPSEGKPSGSSPGAKSPATGVSPGESPPGTASGTA
jgi:hypothetical protein